MYEHVCIVMCLCYECGLVNMCMSVRMCGGNQQCVQSLPILQAFFSALPFGLREWFLGSWDLSQTSSGNLTFRRVPGRLLEADEKQQHLSVPGHTGQWEPRNMPSFLILSSPSPKQQNSS